MSLMYESAIELLREAVKRAGGMVKAANDLGIASATLCYWLNGKRSKQMEIIFSALEKAGGRLVSDEVSLPQVQTYSLREQEEKIRKLELENASLKGQVNGLQTIVYALSGRKQQTPAPTKKAAGE